jgi:hypothetical protein
MTHDANSEKPTAEDILGGMKVPRSRGQLSADPLIRVSKTGHIRFTKGLLFSFGFPKEIAFSFSRDQAFCIPDPKMEGVMTYTLRSVKGNETRPNFLQNTDLAKDLQLIFDKVGADFVLHAEDFMKIRSNSVWKLSCKVIPK